MEIKRLSLVLAVSLLGFCADAANRGTVTSGETRSASVQGPSYFDTWQFYGEAGDRVLISCVTTSGTLNTDMVLYPPGGAGEEHYSNTSDELDHQLEQSGWYTLFVQDYGLNDAGSYNLTFLKFPGAVNYSGDPDGGPVVSGETVLGSVIRCPSDMDVFQFYGEAGDRVVISCVTTSGTLNTDMVLYPPGGAGEEYYSNTSDELDHQLLKSGLYSLVVRDYQMDEGGVYNLTFLKFPGAVNYAGDPDGGPVAPGETVLGSVIRCPSDMDVFQFYGEAGDRVLISCVTTSGTLNTDMVLYPPGGAGEEHYSNTSDSLDHQLLKSGLYSLVVRDYALNREGAYDVSFTKIPFATRPGLYNLTPQGMLPIIGGTLSASWDAVANATAYDVYMRPNATSAFVLAASSVSNAVNLTVGSDVCYEWYVVGRRPEGDIVSPRVWMQTSFGILEIVRLQDARVRLTTSSGPGRSYWVESANSLDTPVWGVAPFSLSALGTPVETKRIGTGDAMNWFLNCETNRIFYRIRR